MKRLLIALTCALVAGCGASPAPEARSAAATHHTIRYDVLGQARTASVTLRNAEGGTEQTAVRVPWSREMPLPGDGMVYVSAQNMSGGQRISCQIYLDGNYYKSSTSYGRASIAGCSGRISP